MPDTLLHSEGGCGTHWCPLETCLLLTVDAFLWANVSGSAPPITIDSLTCTRWFQSVQECWCIIYINHTVYKQLYYGNVCKHWHVLSTWYCLSHIQNRLNSALTPSTYLFNWRLEVVAVHITEQSPVGTTPFTPTCTGSLTSVRIQKLITTA